MIRTFLAMRARLALLASLALLVAACGGGVSGPSPTVGPIAVSPSSATLYSDLPTTFVVTGGNGSYVITSSNQAVLPAVGALNGNEFTLVPNTVAADTPVTLTVSDSAGDAPVNVTLTVKPRTVSNVVTITPSASQSAACGAAICSGGDAEVKVVLSQGGVPLVGRQVRFDVLSGDFRIITSPPGAPEELALSGTATTDNTGTASVRIRVLADATAQTGLLQVTDLGSGFTQRASLTIAPSSNAPLNAQPATIVFQGVAANTCASGISADVIVFGGRPPYLISQPGSFSVSPTLVTNSGGRFTVGATGQCTSGSQIAVVDSNGATVSVTASNKLSDIPPPTQSAFTVSPTTVTLDTCQAVANVIVIGGTTSYFAASSSANVAASVNGNTGVIQMVQHAVGSRVTTASPVTVTFSDGRATVNVTVNLGSPITTPGQGC